MFALDFMSTALDVGFGASVAEVETFSFGKAGGSEKELDGGRENAGGDAGDVGVMVGDPAGTVRLGGGRGLGRSPI